MELKRGPDRLFHPTSEPELIELVHAARAARKKLRVRGSSHSVSDAIYTDSTRKSRVHVRDAPESEDFNVALDQYRAIEIKGSLAICQAGASLGGDPSDPSGSPPEESLLGRLAQADLALHITGGITHQTVSGFIATGSSGGSTRHSMNDNLHSFRLIDGNGDVHVIDRAHPHFWAMAPNLGLLGVVSTVTFDCVPNFAVTGEERTREVIDCGVDLFSADGVQTFLCEHDYARIEWWPQKRLERAVVWQAERLAPDTAFVPDPPDHSRVREALQYIVGFIFSLLCNLDDITHGKQSLLDNFSKLRSGLHKSKTLNKLGPPGRWVGGLFAGAVEFIVSGVFDACRLVRKLIKWLRPWFFPALARLFIPLNKGRAKDFTDWAWLTLPMDNRVDDVLLPTTFTEVWVPITCAGTVMKDLHRYFYDEPGKDKMLSYERTGTYGWELYAAKASDFWLSPSFTDRTDPEDPWRHGALRVDPYWYDDASDDPAESLFNAFWDRMRALGIPMRLHWAKHLPGETAGHQDWPKYMSGQYRHWEDFKQVRQLYDPYGVFLTHYWSAHLEIRNPAGDPPAPEPDPEEELTRQNKVVLGVVVVALLSVLLWADVPWGVKIPLAAVTVAVLVLRCLLKDNRFRKPAYVVGLGLVPVVVLGAIAVLLNLRVEAGWAFVIGWAVLFATAWVYLSPLWSWKPQPLAWCSAAWLALLIAVPAAHWLIESFRG